MQRAKMWFRRITYILASGLGILLLAVLFLTATGWGRSFSANAISNLASNGDQQVVISGLNQIVGNRLEIENLTLSDKEGEWARLSEIVVEYSTTPLFFGGVDVRSVEVEKFQLLRAPNSGAAKAQQKTQNSLLPSPIKSIDFRSLVISELVLSKDVLGIEKALTVTASAQIINKSSFVAGDLIVVDLDDGEELTSAKVRIEPESDSIAIDVRVAEDANGVVANLLDIPNRPAITLNVSTDGKLSALNGKLSIDLDNQRTVDGELLLALSDEQQNVEMALEGEIASLLPDSILPFVAGTSQLNLNLQRNLNGNIKLQKASYQSALTSVEAKGEYLPSSNSIDGGISVKFGDEGTRVEFSPTKGQVSTIGSIVLDGAVKGTLDQAVLSISGKLEYIEDAAVSVSGLSLELRTDNANLNHQQGKLLGSVQTTSLITGIVPLDELLAGGQQVAMSLTQDQSLTTLEGFIVKSAHLDTNLAGSYDWKTGLANAEISSRIESAAGPLFSQLFGPSGADVTADLKLESGVAQIENLLATSDNLNVEFSGQAGANSLSAIGNVSLSRLETLSASLSGSVDTSVALSGSPTDPQLSLELSSQDLALANEPIQNLTGKVDGGLQQGVLIDFGADYNEQPLTLRAYIQQNEGNLEVSDLKVEAPSSAIEGSASVGASGLASGEIQFEFADFSALSGLLQQQSISGSAKGLVQLTAQNGQQGGQLNLNVPALEVTGVRIDQLSVSAKAADLFGKPDMQTVIQAASVLAANESIQNLRFDLAGTDGKFPISGSALLSGQRIGLSANATMDGSEVSLVADKLNGKYKSVPFELGSPITFKQTGGIANVNAPNINVGGGRLSVSGAVSNDIDITVGLTGLPLSIVDAVAQTGQGLRGDVSATASVSGTTANPVVSYQYQANGLSAAASRTAGIPNLGIVGKGVLQGNSLATKNNVSGGGIAIDANGSLNIATTAMDVGISGRVPFSIVAPQLAKTGVKLTGSANIDARLAGNATAPQYAGSITTSGANFVDISSKMNVTDISGRIELDNTTARIPEITGRIGSSGSMRISGQTSLVPSAALESDIDISITDASFDNGLVSAKFGAALKLAGALARGGQISGSANINQANISIPETLPNAVAAIDVVHKDASSTVKQQAAELAPPANDNASSSAIRLNIDVNAPRQIYIRGRGLDAELGGNLNVRGDTGQPKVSGQISMLRGRMDVLTKRFDFDTGQVVFSGPADPTLNFAASTKNDGNTYTIAVQGLASAPEFAFSAIPTVPQDEIVAKIFFGKSLSDLSAIQLAQLAGAIATLSGTGSGPGLLDRIRNLAGLDNIDIKSNDAGETTVGVGAYLNQRTYLNVEKGADSASDKVSIDLEITDSLKARGETTGDGNTKAGLFFEQDY